MGLLAREKLKVEEPIRYEKYMKIQRDKEIYENSINNTRSRIVTPSQQQRPSNRSGPDQEATQIPIVKMNVPQKPVGTPAKGNRYLELDEKEITIVDENKRD